MKILLSYQIEFKGSCHAISASKVERTETKALYCRSDGYWECFYVEETRHDIFQNGQWVKTGDTIERYPNDEKFGRSAWCGRERTIREQYKQLNAVSDFSVSQILARSPESNTIVPH